MLNEVIGSSQAFIPHATDFFGEAFEGNCSQ